MSSDTLVVVKSSKDVSVDAALQKIENFILNTDENQTDQTSEEIAQKLNVIKDALTEYKGSTEIIRIVCKVPNSIRKKRSSSIIMEDSDTGDMDGITKSHKKKKRKHDKESN